MSGATGLALAALIAIGVVSPVASATGAPGALSPAPLSSGWLTTSSSGHLQSSYDALTGPTTGGSDLIQSCLEIGGQCTTVSVGGTTPLTVGITYRSGPLVGVYLQGPPVYVMGQATPSWACGGNTTGDVSSFTVDQLRFNAGGTIAVAAFRFACTHNGTVYTGALSYGSVPTTPGQGYYLFDSNGGVSGFGNDHFLNYLGDPSAIAFNKPVVAMQTTSDGGGYWLATADGGVFTYGDAGFFGSAGNLKLNDPIVGMAATPDGGGYWLVASDGGIFAYGDATFQGSMGASHLNRPIVGMSAPPSGGYWIVASDGGIFSFGNAAFHGSMGGTRLNRPVVGMAPTTDGHGYWMVASDGGVFTFGDAAFHGSTGSLMLQAPITGLAPSPGGSGYWLSASDGGVFAFATPFLGSLGGTGITNMAGIAT